MWGELAIDVPAKDFSQSIQVYGAMGWKVNWRAQDDTLADLELAGNRVYLQNYYNEDWANNFMMHISVDDAREWWEHASRVIGEGGYGAARAREPQEQSYGALVTFAWDPSGVLLHFAEYRGG